VAATRTNASGDLDGQTQYSWDQEPVEAASSVALPIQSARGENGSREPWWKRRTRRPPNEELVLSEAALQKRAKQQLTVSALAAPLRVRTLFPATQKELYPDVVVPSPDFDKLHPEMQACFLRVAQHEAEQWLRKEQEAVKLAAREARRWEATEAKLSRYLQKRQEAEEAAQQLRVEQEVERAAKEKQERLRILQRRKYLYDKLGDWTYEKEERKQAKAEAAAKERADAANVKERAKRRYLLSQKAKLDEWRVKRHEQDGLEAEARRCEEAAAEQSRAAAEEQKRKARAKRRKYLAKVLVY